MLVMVFHVLGENEDEIIIKSQEVIHVLTKDIVHKKLKNTRCICKAKRHHDIFKMAITLS
jgi:hypothetical protein